MRLVLAFLFLVVLIVSILFVVPACATTLDDIQRYISKEIMPYISTPWTNPAEWQGTWQGNAVLTIGSISSGLGKTVGSWLGKLIQEDMDRQQREVEKKARELFPIYNLEAEEWLHSIDEYENTANAAKDPRDLERVIDHVKAQSQKLRTKGKKVNPAFDTFLRRLEQIKDYWQDHETGLDQATYITILAAVSTLLLKLLVLVVL